MFKVKQMLAFVDGVLQFRESVTTSYNDEALNEAFDRGREFAHRVTNRHFEQH